MIFIDKKLYNEIAHKLMSQIGEKGYYRGTVEVDSEELYVELRATLLIYREPLLDPTDITNSATRIKDIVPVWWECRTFQINGEVNNTFSWSEFKEFIQ